MGCENYKKEITANCTDLTRGLNVLKGRKQDTSEEGAAPKTTKAKQNKNKVRKRPPRIYHTGEVFKTPREANPSGTSEGQARSNGRKLRSKTTVFHFLYLRVQIP